MNIAFILFVCVLVSVFFYVPFAVSGEKNIIGKGLIKKAHHVGVVPFSGASRESDVLFATARVYSKLSELRLVWGGYADIIDATAAKIGATESKLLNTLNNEFIFFGAGRENIQNIINSHKVKCRFFTGLIQLMTNEKNVENFLGNFLMLNDIMNAYANHVDGIAAYYESAASSVSRLSCVPQ